MSRLLTSIEITNLFLYGQLANPSNLVSDSLIRPDLPPPAVVVDVNVYMSGPGRFATPNKFDFIKKFFNPQTDPASSQLAPGTYTKAQVFAAFGVTVGWVGIEQALYDDGKDNFLERVYIWNKTAFMLRDEAKFVVEPNGSRYIEDFAIVPYLNSGKKENFDFASGTTFGDIGNLLLKPKIDPSTIGRKVEFEFSTNRTIQGRFTLDDYQSASSGAAAQPGDSLLYASIIANGSAFLESLYQSGSTRFLDQDGRMIIYGTNGQDNLSANQFSFVPIDSHLSDALASKGATIVAGGGNDVLAGGSLNDLLIGGTGDDKLQGGAGTDIYKLSVGWGNDTITDSDGQGVIQIDGKAIVGTFGGVGTRGGYELDIGGGVKVGLYAMKSGNTYKATIVKGTDIANTITINNFNPDGYLGIKLGPAKVALTQESGNHWKTPGATLASLDGKTALLAEGSGTSFNACLSSGAKAGDTITLSFSGASNCKIILGDTTVDANGAVITLVEGQTQARFSLVHDGQLDADAVASLNATYNSSGTTATSNTWGVNLRDGGETTATLNGDLTVQAETNQGGPITRQNQEDVWVTVVDTGQLLYAIEVNGNLKAGNGPQVTDNALFGGSGNEVINGLTGNDLLSGAAGNDQIDGGAGRDMILGGAGNDHIKGGDGDDLIASAASGTAHHQQRGPTDQWVNWGVPAGRTASFSTATWGLYLEGKDTTIWSGVTGLGTDQQSDVIDAGAGNDWVIASWGNDRLKGGAGNDVLDGLVGNDVIEGNAGHDRLRGDGLERTGLLETTPFVSHGTDFLDGGEGNDTLTGGGRDDVLFGGVGDDSLDGDMDGATGTQVHGADYLDGEDGDDTLYGRHGDDILFGGAQDDTLDAGEGNDYLDGETGNDTLQGGDGDDGLFGGDGNDHLDGGAGADYMDGGAGSDTYVIDDEADVAYEAGPQSDQPMTLGFGVQAASASVGGGIDAIQTHFSHTLDDGFENLALIGNAAIDGEGNGYDNAVTGNGAANTLTGHQGNDRLEGGGGDDVYVYNAGDGNDAISNTDLLRDEADASVQQAMDTLRLGEGIAPADLVLRVADSDLVITLKTTGETILVQGYRNAPIMQGTQVLDHKLDRLEFADGTVWDQARLEVEAQLSGPPIPAISIMGEDGYDDYLDGQGSDEVLYGLGGNDQLSAAAGNDVLVGGAGNDYLYGGIGDDAYVFGLGSGSDKIYEEAGETSNSIYLEAGVMPDDVMLIRTGLTQTGATPGSLALVIKSTGDTLQVDECFDAQGGSVISRIQFADAARTVWTAQDIVARATLSISGAANTQTGTAANNTFVVDNTDDRVIEAVNGGIDTVHSSVDYTLDANVENLDLAGVATEGRGNILNNVLRGNAFGNRLFGNGGLDTYEGGIGNDIYFDKADRSKVKGQAIVIEHESEGHDTLVTNMTAVDMADQLEDLLLDLGSIWTPAIDADGYEHHYTGNDQDNLIDLGRASFGFRSDEGYVHVRVDGGAGADSMIGGYGWFTYVVDNADDRVVNEAFAYGEVQTSVSYVIPSNIALLRLSGSDAIESTGDARDNVLDASLNPAANRLAGLDGNDTYYADLGDEVVEAAGGGTDTVILSVGAGAAPGVVSLGDFAHVEALQLADDMGDAAVHGTAAADRLTGNAGGNRIEGQAGNDTLVGGGGSDELLGGAGNDAIHVGAGYALVDGGTGNDAITVAGGHLQVQLGADGGADTVNGAAARTAAQWGVQRDVQSFVALADGTDAAALRLTRSAKDLTVNLGAASVVVKGYFKDALSEEAVSALDAIRLNDGTFITRDAIAAGLGQTNLQAATASHDMLITTATVRTLTGGAGNDHLYGQGTADVLDGGVGNDRLYGGDGQDQLKGSAGNDVLTGGRGADTYLYSTGWGQDVVDDLQRTERALQAGAQLEDDVTLNTIQFDATVAAANIAIQRDGQDLLLRHKTTGETIRVDNYFEPEDGNGLFQVRFANGTVWSAAYIDQQANSVTGTAGNDTLTGLPTGGDVVGLAGSDRLTGQDAADRLYGGAGNDTLTGAGGNDMLNGGTGDDAMAGGTGDDTYYVDTAGDTVTELANAGHDRVMARLSWVLSAHVEDLVLGGTTAINGTGNAMANALTGNAAANVLDGKGGGDVMTGGAGNDTYIVAQAADTTVELADGGVDNVQAGISWTLAADVENLTLTGTAAINGTGNAQANVLTGNAAANVLNGGAGADAMAGGAGNDTYYTDNTGDTTTEAANAGVDTVVAMLTWRLAANIENLTLAGTANINATGNALANTLRGNAGHNTLNGGAGADALLGGAGNDTYVVDNAADTVTELAGEGTDSVRSSVSWTLGAHVEDLTLLGNAAINGTGNALGNVLSGNAGANTLNGGLGNDTYVMGRGYGADTLVDTDATAGNHDVLRFAAGVSASQLWFRKAGSSLEVSIIGTGDRMTVQNWYLGAQHRVEEFQLGSSQLLQHGKVQSLVDAMAGLALPVAGQTDLPPEYALQLNGVLASTWQWPIPG